MPIRDWTIRGKPLRQRQSGKKYNPGRDFTFSAPKSVTLLGLVKEDKAVIEAHQRGSKNYPFLRRAKLHLYQNW